MKAILRNAKGNQFRFNLIGINGEKVATSETYTTKMKARITLRKYFPGFSVVDETKRSSKPNSQIVKG